jgi:hypothetical protein
MKTQTDGWRNAILVQFHEFVSPELRDEIVARFKLSWLGPVNATSSAVLLKVPPGEGAVFAGKLAMQSEVKSACVHNAPSSRAAA